jgi:hypothetical protein
MMVYWPFARIWERQGVGPEPAAEPSSTGSKTLPRSQP